MTPKLYKLVNRCKSYVNFSCFLVSRRVTNFVFKKKIIFMLSLGTF